MSWLGNNVLQDKDSCHEQYSKKCIDMGNKNILHVFKHDRVELTCFHLRVTVIDPEQVPQTSTALHVIIYS